MSGGKLVLGESIGDLGGANIAFRAFQRASNRRRSRRSKAFRVIGPLSNMPTFQAAFSCKADAAMVRPAAERCEIW